MHHLATGRDTIRSLIGDGYACPLHVRKYSRKGVMQRRPLATAEHGDRSHIWDPSLSSLKSVDSTKPAASR